MSNSNGVQSLSFSVSAVKAPPFIPGGSDAAAGTSKRATGSKPGPHPPSTAPSCSPEAQKGKAESGAQGRGNQRSRGGGRGNARPRNVRVNGARPPPLPGRPRPVTANQVPQRGGPQPPSAAPGPVQMGPIFHPPMGLPPPGPHKGPVPPSVPPPGPHAPRHTPFQPPAPRVNSMLAHIPDHAQLHIIHPGQAFMARQFISDAVRNELVQQSYLRMAQVNPSNLSPKPEGNLAFADMIHGYHTLYPLEDMQEADERPSIAFGMCTCVFKGISVKNGLACAIRRVDGKHLAPTAELLQGAREVVERWHAVSMHPNLVTIREVFVTDDSDGISSLHFVHDYIPGAVTAEALHLQPTQTSTGLVINAPTEPQIWNYATQLVAATRAAHAAGLVLGPACFLPTKVLISPASSRLRVSSCGVAEGIHMVKYDNVSMAQREDLQHLGRLLLSLACSSMGAAMMSVEYVATHHSPDLARLISNLLMMRDGLTWQGLTSALGENLLGQLDAANATNDALLWDLGQELENGRLLRLLMKISMIVDKPVLDMDPQWAETGDRYLLKLFRDFVFHQLNEDGTPMVSWGHMVEALNKLDVGSPEKVILLSRNEIDMLVVSYADIKRCLETSYQELLAAAGTTSSPAGPSVLPPAMRAQRISGYFR